MVKYNIFLSSVTRNVSLSIMFFCSVINFFDQKNAPISSTYPFFVVNIIQTLLCWVKPSFFLVFTLRKYNINKKKNKKNSKKRGKL